MSYLLDLEARAQEAIEIAGEEFTAEINIDPRNVLKILNTIKDLEQKNEALQAELKKAGFDYAKAIGEKQDELIQANNLIFQLRAKIQEAAEVIEDQVGESDGTRELLKLAKGE